MTDGRPSVDVRHPYEQTPVFAGINLAYPTGVTPRYAVPELQSPALMPSPAPAAPETSAPSAFSGLGWNSFSLDAFGFGPGGGTSYAANDATSYGVDKGALSQTSKWNGQGGPQAQKVSGSVRPDGASGAVDRSIATEQGPVTTRGNLLASASVDAKVEPCSDPEFGVLVITFTLGGEGGFAVGGVGRETSAKDPEAPAPAAPAAPDLGKHVASKVSGDVGLKVKGSASVALRQRLPIADALRLKARLQVPGSDRYAILDELSMLGGELAQAPDVAALADADVAAAMAEGEGMELSFGGEVGLTAGVAASAGDSMGATASAAVTAKRTIRVEREVDAKGAHLVRVTVSFEDGEKGSLGASGGTPLGGAGVTKGAGASSKQSFVVGLRPDDPQYGEDFHALVFALDAAAVAPIAARLKGKQAALESKNEDLSVDVNLGPFGGQIGSASGRTSGTELNNGVRTGVESGSASNSVGGSLFGIQMLRNDHAETADAKFGQAGGSVAVVDTDTVMKRFCRDQKAALALTLGSSDLVKLGRRFVADPVVWDEIGMSHWASGIGAWHACGAALASGAADVEMMKAGLPPALAVDGTRFAAIATLVASGDGLALGALQEVRGTEWCRRYEGRNGEAYVESDTVGEAILWPPGLDAEAEKWRAVDVGWSALYASVQAVRDEFSGEAVAERLDEADTTLAELERAIATHAVEFAKDATTACGMLVVFAERRAQLEDWRGEVAMLETAACDVDAPAETAVDPAREVARLEAVVVGFKPQETALFERLEAATATALEDGLSAWWTADPATASSLIRDLGVVYQAWVPQIQSLRSAYRAAAIDEADWRVGAAACEARKVDAEPDLNRFQELRGAEGQKVATLLSSY